MPSKNPFISQVANGTPIAALVHAAKEVSGGNLRARAHVRAIDELAGLVRVFNQMVEDLESNSRELEARRRFTEAILESIPTGVLSLDAQRRITHANPALLRMFHPNGPGDDQTPRMINSELHEVFPPDVVEDTSAAFEMSAM